VPDASGSFKTHSGYIKAFSYLCGYRVLRRDPDVINELAVRIAADPAYTASSVRKGVDADQLRRSLNAAWGSELLLALTGGYADGELRALSNTWVAVQAYYACYHATQALSIARGHTRSSSHPRTQAAFVDAWSRSPLLIPWSLAARSGGYDHLPTGHVVDDSVHAWSSLDRQSAVDIACKALRTTRDEAVEDALRKARVTKRSARAKAWREEEAQRLTAGRRPRKEPTFPVPRLTTAERSAVEENAGPRGLIHYLYRLRIKAQYEDATMFTEGPETESDSLILFQHLTKIVRTTLLLHELFLVRISGRAIIEPLVEDWLARHVTVPVNPLLDRRALLFP